jgi:hypothetical protein
MTIFLKYKFIVYLSTEGLYIKLFKIFLHIVPFNSHTKPSGKVLDLLPFNFW